MKTSICAAGNSSRKQQQHNEDVDAWAKMLECRTAGTRNDAPLGRLGIGSARTRRHAVTQAEGDRNVMGQPHVEAIIQDVLRTVLRSEDVSQVRWRHRSLSDPRAISQMWQMWGA